jgi:hypothetical protein
MQSAMTVSRNCQKPQHFCIDRQRLHERQIVTSAFDHFRFYLRRNGNDDLISRRDDVSGI